LVYTIEAIKAKKKKKIRKKPKKRAFICVVRHAAACAQWPNGPEL